MPSWLTSSSSTSSPSPKLNFTAGILPSYVSASEAPTRKSPWRAVRDVGFVQTTRVVLPDELYQIIGQNVVGPQTEYAKVVMKLEDLLEGDFFTEYIKRGNILMLSEGEPGADDTFSLKDGLLRLQLSKDVYERAGLPGTPIRSGGRKHVKSRYLVEYNLRLPSMLHGKKGFERLVWAAKNVLNRSLSWIFCDLDQDPKGASAAPETKRPIMAHHPTVVDLTPTTKTLSDVLVPSTLVTAARFSGTDKSSISSQVHQESIYDTFEYLDMLALTSPRVQVTDKVDPFISRYAVPSDLDGGDDDDDDDRDRPPDRTVRLLTWTGLMSSQWVIELLCAVIKQSRTANLETLSRRAQWVAVSAVAHRIDAVGQVDGYTILLQPEPLPTGGVTDTDDTAMAEGPESGRPGEGKDVEMTTTTTTSEGRPPAGVDLAPTPTTTATPARPGGLRRYVCAEYVDSVT